MGLIVALGVIVVIFLVILGFSRSGRPQSDEPMRVDPSDRRQRSTAETALRRPNPLDTEYVDVVPAGGNFKRESRRCWVPPEQVIKVAGFELPGGMIYVGTQMASLHGWGEDPALINPHLNIRKSINPGEVEEFGYWPKYREIGPTGRAQYLRWLAAGRRDPDVQIGVVFLFFYGIERRLLFDTRELDEARIEIDSLLTELRELLQVYGHSASFHGYASNLITYMQVSRLDSSIESLPSDAIMEAGEVPFALKIALGRKVANGEPIPADLALAWANTHPEVPVRTPARRCREEFEELFKLRYAQLTGGGIKLKRNKTNLQLSYKPASSGNPSPPPARIDALPDVTDLKSPLRKLSSVAEAAQNELAAYSRWVGRNGDRGSPAAIALLPSELMSTRLEGPTKELVDRFKSLITDPVGSVIESGKVLAHWPAANPSKLTRKEAAGMADFLAALGMGIEPDVRYGRINPSSVEQVVLFRSEEGRGRTPAPNLESSTLLLQLGTSIAAADGTVARREEEKLEEHLEQTLQLSLHERRRLRARTRLMLASPPSFSGLKAAFGKLPEFQRLQIGRFALGVAAADGQIDSAEIKTLMRVYKLLGFDAAAVHAELHEFAVTQDDGPTTVQRAEVKAAAYRIPPAPDREGAAVTLDKARIDRIRAETQEVASLLRTIFEGSEEVELEDETLDKDDAEEVTSASDGIVPGLDDMHATLVATLRNRTTISRQEFGELAQAQKLMVAGAIEVINEVAFKTCDEPLIEGEDPLEINGYALQEMLP